MSETVKRDRVSLRRFFEKMREYLMQLAADRGYTDAALDAPGGWALRNYGGANANFFERGLLIGDAGCFADPLTGEGIPVALETAKIAAETLEQAFACGDFSARFLSVYEERWREEYDLDYTLSDLMLTATRNRELVDLWLGTFDVLSRTANRDPAYALKAGGIYGGLLPVRAGLDPDFLMRPLANPDVWTGAFGISTERPLADLAERTVEGVGWSLRQWQRAFADSEWVSDWWRELSEKQMHLLQAFAREAGVAQTRPPQS